MAQVVMTSVQTLPHISYALVKDPVTEILWLNLHCSKCGNHHKKPCTGIPQRVQHWVATYSGIHAHAPQMSR